MRRRKSGRPREKSKMKLRLGVTYHPWAYISELLRSVVHAEDPARRMTSLCGRKLAEIHPDDHTVECRSCIRIMERRHIEI